MNLPFPEPTVFAVRAGGTRTISPERGVGS
ncbi:MAG: hypothetical protein AVDCRST_MAG25-1956 [uncultured Rubrobacteraceae bacterium]|uniref:Uncharacterized protein n=1 Tax=uncultured Rubrobacteraceae bacterium TaxID=349277 RepID=A0A6J4RIK0_9ACTN|nr:MAG: hypothetical protein AVDCRST_MAG25-1956 [uncultured Rubrobacteraceae bacterium]